MTETATSTDELVERSAGVLKQNWDPDLTVGDWWSASARGMVPQGSPPMRMARPFARRPVLVADEIRHLWCSWLRQPASACFLPHRPSPSMARSRDRPLRPRHRHRPQGVVPALQRTPGRFGPGCCRPRRSRTATSGSSMAEGLDLGRALRRPGHAVGPDGSGHAQASRISYFAFEMHQPGVECAHSRR